MSHRYRSLLSAVEELGVRSAEHHSAVPDITVDSDLGPLQKPLDDNIVLCCLPAGILICIFQLGFTVDDRYAPAPGTILDSFPTSKGSLRLDLYVDIPVFFFNFNSASLISYSPTPGLPL